MADGPTFFDAQSAIRIANAVRKVEIGDRAEAALRFRRELPQQQRKTFRIATFSGAWAINSMRTVEFKFQTNTPNTAVVDNLFFPFEGSTSTAQVYDCAIAKDGTAWYLIDVPMQTATAVFITSTASQAVVTDINSVAATAALVSGISVAAVLNTSNCAITVSTTQTTGAVTFVSTVTKSTTTITVVQGTFTASFLSFKV